MKKPTVNKVDADISKLSVFFRGTRKFGKSSTFKNIVEHKFHDPECGLMIKCGIENGDTVLSNVNSVSVKSWRDVKDLEHWLLTEKWIERDEKGKIISEEKLPHHIKMISIDTVSELIGLAEKAAVTISNASPNYKKCHSLNGAFGGYCAGINYVQNQMLRPLLDSLMGKFGVWAIAHTKYATIRDEGALSQGYDKLVSDVGNSYDGLFGDIMDCVVTGTIDRGLEQVETKDNKTHYKSTDTKRYLYFRETPSIDAGSRFHPDSIPQRLEMTQYDMGQIMIDTLENAMRLSAQYSSGVKPPVKEESTEPDTASINLAMEQEPEFENIPTDETVIDDLLEPEEDAPMSHDDMIKKIAEYFKQGSDAEIKALIKSEAKKYKSVKNIPDEVAKEILSKIE